MNLRRIQISRFKNIRQCDIDFPSTSLLNAIIGSNGSGKSNLVEAILHILIGCYFRKPPPFDFKLEYETQHRKMSLEGTSKTVRITVDGELFPAYRFSQRLREGPAQVFYPELTLAYYSGECPRVRQLVARYGRHFAKLARSPGTDRYRPLFLLSSNQQAQVILLALFAHARAGLLRRLRLRSIQGVVVKIRSPHGFNPLDHEPKLWNTDGPIRRFVAALDRTANRQTNFRHSSDSSNEFSYWEERTYYFDSGEGEELEALASRLESDRENLYLALEGLRARGMLRSVSYLLKGDQSEDLFPFEMLSEGEKQLIAVVGALELSTQGHNLILLDEPDTHLNPQWSWEYTSMLEEALGDLQRRQSTVLMATHDPVMISGMDRHQVLLSHPADSNAPSFTRPVRNPRGQGIANLLCSSEYFGLPSSLDKETQKLLDERLTLIVKEELTSSDRRRLRILNENLEIESGVSERDPEFVAFLRHRQHEGER